MKFVFSVLFFLMFTFDSVTAQLLSTLRIPVANIQIAKGVLRLGVYTKETGLFSETYRWAAMNVNKLERSYVFEIDSLPYGEYVVAVYQDLDNDNELKQNFVGFPMEPNGMSNLVTLLTFPSFNNLKFRVDTPSSEIKIKLSDL